MTLPWEVTTAPVPSPAEVMAPDIPAPKPVSVAVTLSDPLQAAIDDAVENAVNQHPVLSAATRAAVTATGFGDKILMHGSAIDLAVATVAAASTFVSPNGWFAAAAWVVAGVMALKTLIHAVVSRASKGSP
jgi:hypothetical protein